MTFQERVEQRKQELAEKRRALLESTAGIDLSMQLADVKALENLVREVAIAIEADVTTVEKRIKTAKKAAQGKVVGLLVLLSKIANNPVVGQWDQELIETNFTIVKDLLEKKGVDVDTLLDINGAYGYHSFLDDEGVVIEGNPQDYEKLQLLIAIIADQLNLSIVEVPEVDWEDEERRIMDKVIEVQMQREASLKRQRELV